VFRPADRIAYVSGQLSKAASAAVLSGAELAERLGVSAPTGLNIDNDVSAAVRAQLIALEKLATAEQAGTFGGFLHQALLANAASVQSPLNPAEVENVKLAEVLCALSDAGVVLPVRDFLALTVKSAAGGLIDSVTDSLPGIFSKMAEEVDIVSSLEQNPYNFAYAASPRVRMWAEKVSATHSVLPQDVEKRAYLAVLRNTETPTITDTTQKQLTKNASNNTPAVNALARHYALYKIAAFSGFMKKYDADGLTAPYCVMQNYVK
jgi:hypothetical protein